MPEARRREPKDVAIDIAICVIVLLSLAGIFWNHVQSMRFDDLVLQMIEARGAGDMGGLIESRDAARVLLGGQQNWTLLGAYVGLGAGLTLFAYRRLQRLL